MDYKKMAKAIKDNEEEMEELEDLERRRFNDCYDDENKKYKKEVGLWRWLFTKNHWDKISQRALVVYREKYGELKDMGDVRNPKQRSKGK